MSGHSKWATIHRAKGIKDAKKGAAFTKLGRAITVAVREGGGIADPAQNFRLRLIVEKARAVNMPKENIERAIEKAVGVGGEALEEVIYEGFLPGGVAVMVECLTDNRLRTQQEVRDVVDKNGGNLGGAGSVGYLFSSLGEVLVDLTGKNAEEAELSAIDLGVEDVSLDEGKLVAYCTRDATFEIKEKLEKLGYVVESAELVMKPTMYIEVADPETRNRVEHILEKLDELDDVQKVFTNYS